MSSVEESTALVSMKANSFQDFRRRSFVTEAFFASPSTMGNTMKIYCAARSASSLRLAPEAITYFDKQFWKGNQLLPLACIWDAKPMENAPGHTQWTVGKLFDYGRKLLGELIQLNTPESLQESELLKLLKSAVGPQQYEKGCHVENCSDLVNCNEEIGNDCITNAWWQIAEEGWNETAEKLSLCKPEKILHSAVELVQERMKEVVTNNSLVSQIAEAGEYFTAMTKSLKSEAEGLSQLLHERRDHALANVTEFWKMYCENHTTLETLQSLVDDFVISRIRCEGLELFSEYVWTMRPQFDEVDLMAANIPHIDDESFHFMAEERVPRRSILFVGRR